MEYISLSHHQLQILGGNEVTAVDKWPWQVYMETYFKNGTAVTGCGGTIISEQWILTAGHCVRVNPPDILNRDIFDVDSAEVILGNGFENNQTVKVEQIIRCPNFTRVLQGNDIALLKLESPLSFDEHVSPICLPNAAQLIPNDGNAVAIGYGTSNERGTNVTKHDHILRETILPIVREDVCEHRWLEYVKKALRDHSIDLNSNSTGSLIDLVKVWFNGTTASDAITMLEEEKFINNVICAGTMGHGVGHV
ncbi:hypothetical protein PMAYCL1PPCAC_27752, partial [Pristionchus mayeri]